MDESGQDEVIAFLSSPESFGGAPVTRIDTHLSHVFLAGDRAYKIMRAVCYDFVDFTSLDMRRKACLNEIAINRRTAPGMYTGVVGIYRDHDALGWHGAGEAVEWAVEMKRFEADAQFDRMAESGRLTREVIASLADKIAHFHEGAEPVSAEKADEGIRLVIDQIGSAILAQIGGDAAQAWFRRACEEEERMRALLRARARHGWVRRCHGDLHLGNICLFEGEPTPFDAIEFSDRLSEIDVLYDLAFLLMDLTYRGLPDLASLALHRYLSLTRDYAGAGLLSLFQSVRAGVRAMVLSLPGRPDAEKAQAQEYLTLANNFLAPAPRARLICVGGFSGAGKSSLATGLALELGPSGAALLLQSDVIRKRMFGVTPTTRLPANAYGKDESQSVYQKIIKDARRALRAGVIVILDATFLNPAERGVAEELARKAGVTFHGFWLTATREVLMNRVAKRSGDPSDATTEILKRQLAARSEPPDWTTIDTSRGPAPSLAAARRAIGVI